MSCGCTKNNKLNNNKILDNDNKLRLESMQYLSIDNDNKLRLESMQYLSIDEIINLYRQGYRLSEPIDNLYRELSLPYLSLATCPTTAILQNTTKDITVTVSGGQPNYVYKLYKGLSGGALSLWQQYPVTGNVADTSHVFTSMAFSDVPGTYTIKGEVTDSCSPTAQVQSDQCNITISAPTCPTPIASITYPVCPSTIQQGAIKTIIVALTGGTGSPPYTYKLFMDGTEINSADTTRTTSNTTYSFGHIFNESITTHTLTATITNNCANTSLVASCSITIQSLPVTTGSLSITSNVDGATVEVDGTIRGVTATGIPVVVSNLTEGSHIVKVSKTDYTTWQQNKTVIASETTAVNAVLTQPGAGGGGSAVMLIAAAALIGIGFVSMKGGK